VQLEAVEECLLKVGVVLYWLVKVWYGALEDILDCSFDEEVFRGSELGMVEVTHCLQDDVLLKQSLVIGLVRVNADLAVDCPALALCKRYLLPKLAVQDSDRLAFWSKPLARRLSTFNFFRTLMMQDLSRAQLEGLVCNLTECWTLSQLRSRTSGCVSTCNTRDKVRLGALCCTKSSLTRDLPFLSSLVEGPRSGCAAC
jgi:hypothetical protein